MRTKTCQLCGYEDELGSIKKYHVVPQEITEQAGIQESRMARLCPNCQQELHKWYSTKVANMTYDTRMKRFRPKSPLEMVKEYETAFAIFSKYKGEQKKVKQSRITIYHFFTKFKLLTCTWHKCIIALG